ncbi:hypothetical protein [Streptomyces sp. NPDC006971]|uniref:hypothetical protein n=1 Tax=Streptomyces sp. NPDC006971 TaxID=3154784 RepID=UPI0033E289E3
MGFDADTGRLDAAPKAPAYGTKLRWIAPKLIAAATTAVPTANVRTLNILRPSPGKTSPTTTGTVAPAVPRTLPRPRGPNKPGPGPGTPATSPLWPPTTGCE